MTLEEIQNALNALTARANELYTDGGYATFMLWTSELTGRAAAVVVHGYRNERPINASGSPDDLPALFAAARLALDERDPKLMDATLGIGSAA